MTTGDGLRADAWDVAIRNACTVTGAKLAADLGRLPVIFGARGTRPQVVLFDAARHDDLTALLAGPIAAVIDIGCDDPLGGLARLPSALLVRVSTAMALRRDIAGPVTAALCRRLPQALGIGDAVHTALQEAIGNAVMHGNLGLDGRLRAKCEGLAAFAAMMENRANDPAYARRPVTIAAKWNAHDLVVTVEDRGNGYDPARHAGCPPTAHAASGRGLAEIRAACRRVNVVARGRRIAMRFRLDPHSTPR